MIAGIGQAVVDLVSPFFVDAHTAHDLVALAAACQVVKVSAMVVARHSSMVRFEEEAHLAVVVVYLRLAFVQVAQEVHVAGTAVPHLTCLTSSPRDPVEPEAADHPTLCDFCPGPVVLRQKCWRRRRRAGRKRPGQIDRGRSRDLAGFDIAPSCVSSPVGLYCCSGAESARHPALPKGHRPLCSLGVDSEPDPCQYQGMQRRPRAVSMTLAGAMVRTAMNENPVGFVKR